MNTSPGFDLFVDPNIDGSITRILENNLTQLESLRAGLERTGNKDIGDVRDFGESYASSLLVGFEGTVTYYHLLDVINEFKDGIARRRVG